MSAPSKARVRDEVLRQISTHTTRDPGELADDQQLKKPPLLFDNLSLVFLAESLRGYVRQYNRAATVKVAEMRKSGTTVGNVVEMIQDKVQAR